MQNKISFTDKYLPSMIIVAFTFILYANTITNDYALDDLIVINGNAFTKKGFNGLKEIFSYDSFTGFFGKQKKLVAGGRYRPLSMATFAIEYGIFKDFRPGFSHFLNIVFYALTGILLFLILSRLIKPHKNKNKNWYMGIPFIATLIFLAHPVHTEVVANIKGRDEIFALMFSLLTVWLVLLYIEKKKLPHLLLAAISFFLGLLSKENTIMFLLIIPLTIYFFTTVPLQKNVVILLPMVIAALLFLYIRFLVLGYLNSSDLPRELLNNPFLDATTSQKYGTILFTLGLYLKLLFFPHPLTHDYNPYQVPLVDLADLRALIPLLLYGVLIYLALKLYRKKHLVSYSILFYLITLFIVSNIIFTIGTFMNERFIYMPSVGFALIAAWFFVTVLPVYIKNAVQYKYILATALILVLLLFSIATIARNKAWKDDFTLFTTDVKTSVNSTKCNTSAGGKYFEKAQKETDTVLKNQDLQMSEQYLNRAIKIYPGNKNCLLFLGNIDAVYHKDYKGAIGKYLEVIALDGYNENAFNNTLAILNNLDNAKEADYKISICNTLGKVNPNSGELTYVLGKLYGQFKGNLDTAEYFFRRAIEILPDNAAPYKDLGVLYGMQRKYDKAIAVFKKAAELDPKDEQVRQNLAITYQMIEQTKNASLQGKK
jgi:protein O-mannosyl-transferase